MAAVRERIKSTISQGSENDTVVAGKQAVKHSSTTSTTIRAARGALGDIANYAPTTHRTGKNDQTARKNAFPKFTATSKLSTALKTPAPPSPQELQSYIIDAPVRPSTVRDIDVDDEYNPQLVSEYINEIYVYLRQLEDQQSVRPNYMQGYNIKPRMRTILIDWLIQVHQRFHLLQETLYLTVALMDRFLQVEEVLKNELQLVGVTAMWIASKYEEMYAPEIADFVYITDDAYSKSTIRKMERLMLKTLNFNLGRPLPLHFLRRYSKAAEVDSMKHSLAKYLLELSLIDYNLAHVHPSEVSAACLCLSIKLLDEFEDEEEGWDSTIQFYSTYTEEQLRPTMCRLALLVHESSSSKHQAVRQKYQASKFMKISMIEELSSPLIEDYAQRAREAAAAL